MKIMCKEIMEDGSKYIIYIMDAAGSPITCEYANNDDKDDVITKLKNIFGVIDNYQEMTYNEYINQ